MRDRIFKIVLALSAVLILLMCGAIFYSLSKGSIEALSHFGIVDFVTGDDWDPNPDSESYGAMPFIVGTLMTSFLALVFCIPFALSVALFNGEYFRGKKVAHILSTVVDLLAGIPSVIYGLWGFYTLRPLIVSLGLSQQGFGILTASIVLAIMIIPYAASLSTQFISMVSNDLKEGVYSLGGTRWDVVKRVILPNAGAAMTASFILALGRALGETMAVTMLIGNTNNIPTSITDTANSMASVIANQFGESSDLRLSSLVAIGLLLFLITAVINYIGKMIVRRFN
ncbi:MAG: phosphate ABC transporter permease subunit PstC [Rikenellaceae bacterium]